MNLIALVFLALALPAPAAEVKNPVPPSADSVASGRKIYVRYCAACHGKEGRGDGLGGAKLDPTPSNLTDAEWKHGPADGDIFLVIRDGAKDTGMKAFGSRLTEHEIWDVVNYIRSLKQ
jgi:mono/diheme cytochrome c family protein